MNAEYNTELDIAASYFPSSAGEKHLLGKLLMDINFMNIFSLKKKKKPARHLSLYMTIQYRKTTEKERFKNRSDR